MNTTTDAPVRCTEWTRTAGLAPAGSAGRGGGFLLVDVALPWPGDVGASEVLRDVAPLASASGLRLQATVPEPGAAHRVAAYRPAPGNGFTRFAGREARATGDGPEALAEAVRTVLDGGGEAIEDGEILVCTHGARDACCGSFGTTLFMELLAAAGEPAHVQGEHAPAATGPVAHGAGGRPVRRTSHTGGHRFAPTAILLPEGSAWAWVDAAVLSAVAERRGPVEEIAAHYRGCAGLGSPAAQALEAALLPTVGWGLFDAARRMEELGDGRWRAHVGGPDGTTSVWEAQVRRGRSVDIPACGEPLGGRTKPARELDVIDLAQVG